MPTCMQQEAVKTSLVTSQGWVPTMLWTRPDQLSCIQDTNVCIQDTMSVLCIPRVVVHNVNTHCIASSGPHIIHQCQ